MIPLILLALGLGAALTVYEFSPRTRSRVDAYARAIRSAHAAHRTADAHLGNANAAALTAVRHTRQAAVARQAAPRPAPTPPFVQPTPTPPFVQPTPTPPFVQPTPTPPFVQPTPTPPFVQPTPTPPFVQPTPTPPFVQPTPPSTPAPALMPEPVPEPVPTPLPPSPYAPLPSPYAPLPARDVADAQANAAQVAADAAVEHAAAAIEANQAAAQNTAEAAKNAQDEAQRQAAAQSAAKVLEREKKIAAALASLGVGQCGVRSYPRVGGGAIVTERVKNALLAKLRTEGMGVTGDNPWNIDTREYGVKLRAVWDPKAGVVKLIVTSGKGGYLGLVTCEEIWKKIDPIMKEVIG